MGPSGWAPVHFDLHHNSQLGLLMGLGTSCRI